MNVLYLPHPVQAPVNRSFAFNRKNERIDWRRIGRNLRPHRSAQLFHLAALDVDRVSRDLDFQTIQENIEQITLCNIDAEVVSELISLSSLSLSFIFRTLERWTRISPNSTRWLN